MGISSALKEKVSRKHGAILASQCVDLLPAGINVCHVAKEIRARLMWGQNGLIEGSQGALLSLNHGLFPYTTSYDVNTASLLGSIGIPMSMVSRIYGVVKAFPTRVSGASGPMLGERQDYDALSAASGTEIPAYRRGQTEEDNTIKAQERACDISLEEVAYGAWLSDVTHIIVTHMDWLSANSAQSLVGKLQRSMSKIFPDREIHISFSRHGEEIMDFNIIDDRAEKG
jgi:adenylosuccinate synthase